MQEDRQIGEKQENGGVLVVFFHFEDELPIYNCSAAATTTRRADIESVVVNAADFSGIASVGATCGASVEGASVTIVISSGSTLVRAPASAGILALSSAFSMTAVATSTVRLSSGRVAMMAISTVLVRTWLPRR